MDPTHSRDPSDASQNDWFDQYFNYESYNPSAPEAQHSQDLDRTDLTTGVSPNSSRLCMQMPSTARMDRSAQDRPGLSGPSDSVVKTVLKSRQAKRFHCEEPQCDARYVRQSELRRHEREAHTDEEFLCPISYQYCNAHRPGRGFKRMDRLISHLKRSPYWSHPCLPTKKEAEYVARDYNDFLQARKMGHLMVFESGDVGLSNSAEGNMEENCQGVPWKYSDMFLYKISDLYEDLPRYGHVPREHLRSFEEFSAWQEKQRRDR